MAQQIDKLMAQINKQLGDNTIAICSESNVEIPIFPSGSLMLDLALGGGWGRGRIIEIYGDSMAGKTTVTLLSIAALQREEERLGTNRRVVFVDAEHALNKRLAQSYGVDLTKLIYVNPKTAENAIDVTDALIRSGEVALIVIDSVPSLLPTKILESSIEQQTMALLARFMSTALQKLTGVAYENETSIIFINQIREKVGVMYGNPETTPGGRALPFYSSQRIRVRKGDEIKDKNEVIGHNVKIKVIKNKLSVPFKECMFPLIYDKGVDLADEVVQVAILAGFVHQAGAWFRILDNDTGEILKYGGQEMKFQGKASLVEYLKQCKPMLDYLEGKVRGVEIAIPDGEREDDEGY